MSANVCPICSKRYAADVFEAHVNLCLKQSVEQSSLKKELSPNELNESVNQCEKLLFDILDEIEKTNFKVRTDPNMVHISRHLATSLRNGSDRLLNCYRSIGIELLPNQRRYSLQRSPIANNNDDEEKKLQADVNRRRRSIPNLSEDQELLFQEFVKREGTCNRCQLFKGPEAVLVMDSCDHRICTPCLREYLLRCMAAKNIQLTCPNDRCLQRVPDWMSKRVLSEDEYDRLLGLSLQGFIEESGQRFVKCPNSDCDHLFEPVAGNVQENDASMDGKPLSAQAKLHKAQNRFRCQKCSTIFCAQCNSIPYHLGFTCEQFKEYQDAKHCRFCEIQLTKNNTAKPSSKRSSPALLNVCSSSECIQKRDSSCMKLLKCGHECGGIKDEKECLGCMYSNCDSFSENHGDREDFCNICWVESIGSAPAIRLDCGHTFHYKCVKSKLARRWGGARITFQFMNCPLCKRLISHPKFNKQLKPLLDLKRHISAKAVQRLKYEGLENDEQLKDPTSPYFEDPESYSMDRFAYYPCYKCKRPYFGGRRECEEAANDNDGQFNPEELVCGSCVSQETAVCQKHGKDFIEYKCKWCCSVASFYCWGTTHFCAKCHKRQEQGDYLTKKKKSELPVCPGMPSCPLGVVHPPNGTEFSLGCALCNKTLLK